MTVYRDLTEDQLPRLRDIDRSEHIGGVYRLVDGTLALSETSEDAAPWSDAMHADYAQRLLELMRAGGRVIGAWDDERLIGFGSLSAAGVGGDATLLQLDMLYVSRAFRGRGIGGELTRQLSDAARSMGADALYISATPTRGTVNAYLHLGAQLVEIPDPELFEREPEDIHLVLPLGSRDG